MSLGLMEEYKYGQVIRLLAAEKCLHCDFWGDLNLSSQHVFYLEPFGGGKLAKAKAWTIGTFRFLRDC